MFESSEEVLGSAEAAHPAIFSFGIAFAKQLMHWGVIPDTLIGHSIGEYTGICLAGVLDIKSVLQLIQKRASLIESVGNEGRMLAIIEEEARVKEVIVETGANVDIAAVNGEKAVVVSGYLEELKKIENSFKKQQVSVNYLSVSHAAHSCLMDPVIEELTEYARGIEINKPVLHLVSNVKGEFITDKEISHNYWADHLRKTVRFHKGVEAVLSRGIKCFIEIGFKPTLNPLIKESFSEVTTINISQPKFERTALLTALTNICSYGIDVNWEEILAPFSCKKTELPTYEFNRSRFWFPEVQNTMLDTPAKNRNYKLLGNIYTEVFKESFEESKELNFKKKDPINIVCFRNRIKEELGVTLKLEEIENSKLNDLVTQLS
ncbi:acyltransferase domain-containing protein [Aquimarina agarivorans]|uniref:acyltransferase domain-containing protein n=1 Tax=Aquimarina agarivorans TaxID=980584 RepID=UPI000248FD19|nr:acyltransferase domain-containing protein [Aquimarina agarivorans]